MRAGMGREGQREEKKPVWLELKTGSSQGCLYLPIPKVVSGLGSGCWLWGVPTPGWGL